MAAVGGLDGARKTATGGGDVTVEGKLAVAAMARDGSGASVAGSSSELSGTMRACECVRREVGETREEMGIGGKWCSAVGLGFDRGGVMEE